MLLNCKYFENPIKETLSKSINSNGSFAGNHFSLVRHGEIISIIGSDHPEPENQKVYTYSLHVSEQTANMIDDI